MAVRGNQLTAFAPPPPPEHKRKTRKAGECECKRENNHRVRIFIHRKRTRKTQEDKLHFERHNERNESEFPVFVSRNRATTKLSSAECVRSAAAYT